MVLGETNMNNIANIPWYLVLGFLLCLGIVLVWAIEMVWNAIRKKRQLPYVQPESIID